MKQKSESSVEMRSVGRPQKSPELRKVFSVSLEPWLADRIRDFADGNLSAGITRLAIDHINRTRVGDEMGSQTALEVSISDGPRTIGANGDQAL